MSRPKHLFLIILPLFFILSSCASKDLTLVREEAYLAYQNKDYSTAINKFEILVEKAPEDVEFWFRLGNSYARSEKPQLAVIAYQNALLRDPSNVKAWYNMGFIQTQTALISYGKRNYQFKYYIATESNYPSSSGPAAGS